MLYKLYVEPFMSEHEGDLEDILEAGRAKALSVLSTTITVITNIVRSEFLAGQDTQVPAEGTESTEAHGTDELHSKRKSAAGSLSKPLPSQLQDMARSASSTAKQWISDAAQNVPPEPPRRKLPSFRRKAN